MILRNWINKIVGSTGTYYPTVKTTGGITQNHSLGLGSSTEIYADNYKENSDNLPSSSLAIGLAIGSGTTTPTINDFKMENAIITNLNAAGAMRSIVANTNSSIVTLTQPITNTGESSITVSEVGVFAAYNTSGACMLLSRDIISPVTIAPNESKTFVLTIDFAEMSTSASVS